MQRITIAATLAAATFAMSAAPGFGAQSGAMSLTQAVSVAERVTGGRVLEAEADRCAGAQCYELEVVSDGRLHELTIDAATGRVMKHARPLLRGYWSSWFEADRFAQVTKTGPLSRFLEALEQQTGGQVLEASFEGDEGQPHYEVEIATSAGVTDVGLHPQTGERLATVLDD